MENKITSMRLTEYTKQKLQETKKHPRETNEEALLRLIKQEVNKDDTEN